MTAGLSRLPALGDLVRLVEAGGAGALLAEAGLDVNGVQATYVRLKPGEGALVGIVVEHRGGALPGYVRTTSARRCTEVVAKWARLRVPVTPLGPGVVAHPGGRSLICLFPADAALRQLPRVSAVDALKRELSALPVPGEPGLRVSGRSSELHRLRYKPERRFVAHLDARLRTDGGPAGRAGFVVRYLAGERGPANAAAARALYRAGAPVPEPLGALLGGRLLVERHVPGTELAAAASGGAAPPEALADAIGRFHRCGAHLDAVVTPAGLMTRAQRSLAALTGVLPAETGRARAVLGGLYRTVPDRSPVSPIHGDLHLHQVILGPAGPVLVDVERAAMGDPLHDVGSLVAHLRATGGDMPDGSSRDFEDGLVDAVLRDGAGPWSRLAFHVACGLVEQALLAFRRIDPAWPERAAALLAQADDHLTHRHGACP